MASPLLGAQVQRRLAVLSTHLAPAEGVPETAAPSLSLLRQPTSSTHAAPSVKVCVVGA